MDGVSVRIDHAALGKITDTIADAVARTLAHELLGDSTEEIEVLGAVDTGAMRASGYAETPTGGINELAEAAASAKGVRAQTEWTPAEPGEAKVAYGAEYAYYVHEGLGSNGVYGPRPFLKIAGDDLASRAQEIGQKEATRLTGT